MFSGLPPIATHARTFWIGSLVPEAVIGRTSPCWMIHLPCAPATQGAQGKSEIASTRRFGRGAVIVSSIGERKTIKPGWLQYERAVNSNAQFLREKIMEQPANTSDPLVGTWKLVPFLKLWRR